MKEDINKIIISPRDSIKKAMERIDKAGLRCVLVADQEKRLLGILTDGDIRQHILKDINLDLSVRVIMNTRPIALRENYTLKEARETMINNSITLIPIVDKNKILVDYLHLPDVISELERNGEFQRNNRKNNEVKKVLVIGGAGYVGSILVRKLIESGYKVRVMDILLYGDTSIKELYAIEDFEFMHGDCRNMQDIIRGLEEVDAVIHLGEIVGDPACSLNPDFTIEVNYMATKTLAEACCYCGIDRFIFSSSCSVYGANDEEVDENSVLSPTSLYARCKVESEKAILSINDAYFSPVVLRLATVYGLSYRPRFDLVINLLTAKAVKEKKIEIYGGEQWRPFISTGDVADAIIYALKAETRHVSRKIFNIGSNAQNYKIYDIGQLIKQAVPHAHVEIKKDIKDNRNYKVRFDKIKQLLGFECKVNTLDEIIRMRDYILNTRDIDVNDPRFSNYKAFIGTEVS